LSSCGHRNRRRAPSDGGDLRPGRDGWAINVDKLPEIIAELQRLETEARDAGVLE
jgi:hypothetical protein